MVDAIKVAKTNEQYDKLKKEIDKDPRNVSDLFVDRYGAQPVQEAFLIPDGKFDLEVLRSAKLTAVEFFDDDSIECLNYSIPIKELFKDISLKYRRQEIKDKALFEKYDIKILPSMLFFRNGKLVGKIQGHYHNNAKKDMIEQVNEIISSA